MTTSPHETWVSLSEAARRLGVHRRTIRRLLDDSDIELLHLQRNIRIRETDLARLREVLLRPHN